MSAHQIIVVSVLVAVSVYGVGYTVGRIHRHIHFKRFGLLLSVSAAVCLSGCLTASKIRTWELALLGWTRNGTPECVDAAKTASTYLVNANQRLQGATGITDVQTDGDAKKLMQDAARKCGEVVP